MFIFPRKAWAVNWLRPLRMANPFLHWPRHFRTTNLSRINRSHEHVQTSLMLSHSHELLMLCRFIMAALRAAKQALRREIKSRVAAVSDQEKLRQSRVVSQKVNVIDASAERHELSGVLEYTPYDTNVILLQILEQSKCADTFTFYYRLIDSRGTRKCWGCWWKCFEKNKK